MAIIDNVPYKLQYHRFMTAINKPGQAREGQINNVRYIAKRLILFRLSSQTKHFWGEQPPTALSSGHLFSVHTHLCVPLSLSLLAVGSSLTWRWALTPRARDRPLCGAV